MIKKRLFVLSLICFLAVCSVIAQQSNPFDITNRNSEANNTITPIQIVADSNQIIQSNLVQNSEQLSTIDRREDTLSIEAQPDPIVNNSEPKTSFLDVQQQKLMQQNPFNISHIPLKRTKKSVDASKKSIVKKVPETEPSQALAAQTVTVNEVVDELQVNKFIFWLLLLQLLLITSLLGINREIIKKIYRSISNDNFAKLVSRDYNGGYNALFVILYILFFLSLSIFIYLLFRNYYGLNGFGKYLLVLLSVIGVYAFRHIFQGVSGYVFPFGKTSSYFNFMIILFNSFLGLILIPINVIVAYAPSGLASLGIYLGIGSIIVLYLLRFLRGSLHAYTYVRNYLFHFFLYLCTCEFAPVLILVKFLSKSFIN